MCKTFFIFASTNPFLINPERASPITLIYIRPMSTTPEAYVHLSEDQTTLTFYYDSLRADRDGTTWGIEKKNWNDFSPAWTGAWSSPNTTVLTAVFDASFRDFRPTTTARWYTNLYPLKSIEGLEHLNTTEVRDMKMMFFYCESLTALDLSHFDCSKVKDMSRMFEGCQSLTNLNLSNFDTVKVTNLWGMFKGCQSLTDLDPVEFRKFL